MNDARSFLRLLCAALLFVALAGNVRVASAAEATGPSLYEFIRAHVDPATGTLTPAGMTLPDEPSARRFSRLRWVPGAFEGLGTRHMQWGSSEKASRVARLLERIAAGGSASTEAALYEMLRTDDVVTFYADALDYAASRTRDVEPTLHQLALRLATTSNERGPVKFGIAMLGSMGDASDLPVLQTLALHDEFGLYAAQAIAEIAPDRQRALHEMASKLSGWGRIEAVAQMVATSDPALRRWLLTEGFHNSINPQYLAHQCAAIADLAGALTEMDAARVAQPRKANAALDVAVLVGAAELLQALVKPGPAPGLDNYADAPQATGAFLRLIQKRHDSLSFFLTAQALRDYARSHDTATETVAHWTREQLDDTARLASLVTDDSSWRRHVIAAIAGDGAELDQAATAAEKLKLDTFDLHLRALTKNPASPQRWPLAFAAADPARATRLIALAERSFKPHITGARKRTPVPSSSRTTDAQTAATLEAILQNIASYPGSGVPLIQSSLADHNDRVRRAAVETLVRWGSTWLRDTSVRTALNDAARDEADEALKARMVALLNLATLP